MTLNDPRKPKKRRVLWLVLVVLVVCGLYSAGWFYFAERLRAQVGATIAAINAEGANADCANLRVSGYPLRFAVSCDNTAYEDPATNVVASTGRIDAVAKIYRPLSPVADIVGPLRISAPSMTPLWLDWDAMRAKGDLSWSASGMSLQGEGVSGQTDPQDNTDPVQLFSAGNADAKLQPVGQDVETVFNFTELQIDPEALGGRVVPPLAGNGFATLKNGVTLLAAQSRSLRGQSLEIGLLDLSSGTAHISVSGPIAVDADGLIDADLTIKLQDPNAAATILATAIPEEQKKIQQGFGALAMLGSEPVLPLKIVKGKASLGFIRLGQIKPLE